MTEIVGTAAGLISLAALFNTIIDDIKYIQFGRNFRSDFQVSILQLSNAQLRLSRWGKSVGLSNVTEETQSLGGTLISKEDIEPAQVLLRGIQNELQRAEDKSTQYVKSKKPADKSLRVFVPEEDLGYSGLSLLEIGRDLVRGRHTSVSNKKKAKWALYDRGHFKDMLDNVTRLTSEIVELFPAAKVKQERLRDGEEMTAFTGALRELHDAIGKQDDMLAKALDRLLNPASETYNFTMGGGHVAQQGKNTGQVNQTVNNKS